DQGIDINNNTVTVAHPTGTVAFSVTGGTGTFAPASCTLVAAGAAADSTCNTNPTYTPSSAGTHTLTASHAGDTDPVAVQASSGTHSLTATPQTGGISGSVFTDINNDGTQNAGEPGISTTV